MIGPSVPPFLVSHACLVVQIGPAHRADEGRPQRHQHCTSSIYFPCHLQHLGDTCRTTSGAPTRRRKASPDALPPTVPRPGAMLRRTRRNDKASRSTGRPSSWRTRPKLIHTATIPTHHSRRGTHAPRSPSPPPSSSSSRTMPCSTDEPPARSSGGYSCSTSSWRRSSRRSTADWEAHPAIRPRSTWWCQACGR